MVEGEQQRAANLRPRPRRLGTVVTALAAGLAGGLLAPLVYPAIARGARPATKKALKVGFAAFERGRVAAAEFGEQASDLLAEARSEYEQQRKPGVEPREVPIEVVNLRGPGREAAGD